MDDQHVQVTINLQEAHNVSVGLGGLLDENDIPVGTGVVACLMLVGRLMGPEPLDEDGEIAFLKSAMEWAQAYFMEGRH